MAFVDGEVEVVRKHAVHQHRVHGDQNRNEIKNKVEQEHKPVDEEV